MYFETSEYFLICVNTDFKKNVYIDLFSTRTYLMCCISEQYLLALPYPSPRISHARQLIITTPPNQYLPEDINRNEDNRNEDANST